MDIKSWESLSRKIDKLNEKYRGASLVVFGCVGKQLMVAGSAEMKVQFAEKAEVKSTYKSAMLSQTFETPNLEAEAADAELPPSNSVSDTLSTHVYDMNVDMMRVCLTVAAGPPNTITSKTGRRFWYRKEENCPEWWKMTGIPFQSVNRPGPNGKKLTTNFLMQLVESLQLEVGILPRPPCCPNKSAHKSIFVVEPPQPEDLPVQVQPSTSSLEPEDECPAPAEVVEPPQPEDLPVQVQPSTSSLEPEDECPAPAELTMSLSERKDMIHSLAYCDTKSQLEAALEVMGLVKSWDVLWGLSDCILDSFRKTIPTCLSTKWSAEKLVDKDKRYKDFIPITVGERVVLEATPDGNCIFNAVSIALTGNEKQAMILRLLAVAAMADQLVEFSKYLYEEYQDVASVWCESSTQATPEAIEKYLRKQLLVILQNPYRDGSILHLLLLCHLLSRPIQQHCESDHHIEHRQLLHPPLTNIQHPSAIHLVWVPTRPKNRYATINHVVPAVCKPGLYGTDTDECAFAGLGICALTYGHNCHITKPDWVCCSICDQWVHTLCLGIPHDMYQRTQFACGCDCIRPDGSCLIKRMDFYRSLDAVPDAIDLKDIAENLPDSLRRSVFEKPGNLRLRHEMRCRLGPFNDEFIHTVNMRLRTLVREDEMALVPDMYMPEVLIRIVMKQEDVNRLIAERILMTVKGPDH